jgi:hypothetical protein
MSNTHAQRTTMSQTSSTERECRRQSARAATMVRAQTVAITTTWVGVYWLPRMTAGSTPFPAVASRVKAVTTATTEAPHASMTAPARRRGATVTWWSSRAYAMTNRGKPPCQNMYIQAVLWGPAPSRPVGAKRPGKVRAWQTVMVAVNRYALARTASARVRRIANWPKSRTAVTRSQTTSADS